MNGRRASSPPRRPCAHRLLLRVYAADNLKHVSSQGTYVKISVEESEAVTRGSARASLKRLLHGSARANHQQSQQYPNPAVEGSDDPFALPPRLAKTQVQKSTQGKPVWNEKFELPVFDVAHDVLHLRVKSARLLSAPAIGAGELALRDVPRDGSTTDRWINLFDASRKPAGRLRIQLRLATSAAAAMASSMPAIITRAHSDHDGHTNNHTLTTSETNHEERDTYYRHPRRTTTASSSSSFISGGAPSPLPRSNRRGAIIAPPLGGVAAFRRSSTLSRSLLEARASSGGSTTASDSISSDTSHQDAHSSVVPYDMGSDPLVESNVSPVAAGVAMASVPPPAIHNTRRDTDASSTSSRFTAGYERSTGVSRTTALSIASRDTEELDFLASKYMIKSAATRTTTAGRTTSYPLHEEEPAAVDAVTLPPPPPPPVAPLVEAVARQPVESTDTARRISREASGWFHPVAIAEEGDDEQPVSPGSSSASASPPSGPSLSEIKQLTQTRPAFVPSKPSSRTSAKDDRSPRTTNTTAMSSDEDDATIEFDFDTGDVRPSTRLPSHMMRSTVSRWSVATTRIESDDDDDESDDDNDDDDNEPEDDEMDPDGDPDGPRMVLRATVTRLLRRESVNVIMDVDEEDDDDDDFELDPFVFDEFPILDMSDTLLQLKDIDCTDRTAAAAS